MRTAAAAAIAFMVVGGGWGVYTRVEQGKTAKVVVMPLRAPGAVSFSSTGAVRTPTTIPGPAVKQPAKKTAAAPKKAKTPPVPGQPAAQAVAQ
jgi:hypothetical protein